jgi:prepilin-type N-terminal cleavage/methylation domain-containing protein
MSYGRFSQERGFSLIESMIATSILTISVLGLVQLMGMAIHQGTLSRTTTMAMAVAEKQLEDLRTKYHKDLENDSTSTELTEGAQTGPSVILSAPTGSAMGAVIFDVSWSVVFQAARQKAVNVTVTPQNTNPQQMADATMTTVFSP